MNHFQYRKFSKETGGNTENVKGHFQYHSEQVHKVQVNGKSSTRRNIVHVNNGKGYKELNTNGKSKRKTLTKKELSCIKKGKFIPGLFNDCVKPLRPNKTARRRKNN